MSATAKILDRLEGVKATGPNRWIAKCPAHQDRTPSLSIRETDDRVLVRDFGGCCIEDVLAAIGLSLADLFDRPLEHYSTPSHSRVPARDVLECISFEIDVCVILLGCALDAHETLNEIGWERLAKAARLIGQARDSIIPAQIKTTEKQK